LKKYLDKSEILECFRKIETNFPKRIYCPAYAVPVERYREETYLKPLKEKYGITHLWRMNWRQILDLKWLTNLFGLSGESQWINTLRTVFFEAVADKDMTFQRLVEAGGFLESRIEQMKNSAMMNASKRFVETLRNQQYLFSETDEFSKHLQDPFSYNVLTFSPTWEYETMNQFAFIIALQGIIIQMQDLRKKSQPLFVFSDMQIPAGKDAISEKFAKRAITNVLNGFGRSGSVGFIAIMEAHNHEEISKALYPSKNRYTHMIRLNPFMKTKGQLYPKLRRGKGAIKDNILQQTEPSIYFRPPFSDYTG
jgi:hypothetical protein